MKHVYLICKTSRAVEYGIGTYIKQITDCLKANDTIKLTIIEMNYETAELKVEKEESNQVRKITLPFSQYLPDEKSRKRNLRNISYLLALYVKETEDNIFHFNFTKDYSLFGLLKQRWPNSKIVLTIHYLNWSFILKGNMIRFRSILKKNQRQHNIEETVYYDFLRDKQLFQEIDKIICVSKQTKEILVSDYNVSDSKIDLIYNGLNDDAVLLDDDKRRKKKESLLFGADEKIILFAGRLDELKGLEALMNAFQLVLTKMSNVRLLIAGNGNYDLCLKNSKNIWSKVVFTGKVEKFQLYEFYQIADIGIMPSFTEQCNYVMIEMMMHGIPIIGTDSSGLREMIENKKNGYKLKYKETEEDV
jgi:glycosyltransferase